MARPKLQTREMRAIPASMGPAQGTTKISSIVHAARSVIQHFVPVPRLVASMRCQRAIIYYKGGRPESYCLLLDEMGRSVNPKNETLRETVFKEAYELFPAIRKNWNPDGTAKD